MNLLDGFTDSMDMSLSRLREFVMDRQGSLVCCSPWGCKESDTDSAMELNCTEAQ